MTSPIVLFDTSGQRVPLSKKLGTGGEGIVYDAPFYGPDFVAKLYHHPLSPIHQAKLLAMVEGGNESLRKIAAWPIAALYTKPHGDIRGFVMPKVVGYDPIHHLYGPGHRKQRFPDADWAFLVNAARNLAAAFDIIHTHHHIIGDVNQNNVVVARNSVVKLIDCDSFQIATPTQHYLCEVGVSHFTPPELQGYTFRGIQRTRNHDNFGLAILIFHLLLMGRHPYCGVYSGEGEMPIEKAIREMRFAFGINAAAKKMMPPPNSVPLDILPQTLAWLFERAFSGEGNAVSQRPTAREWLTALEALKEQLKICSRISSHHYFEGLKFCPWCKLEEQSKISFFNIKNRIDSFETAGTQNFDLNKVWEEISAVPSPGAAPLVTPMTLRTLPTPLPHELNHSFILFRNKKYRAEKKKRESAVIDARLLFKERIAQWKEKGGDEIFNEKFRELFYLRLAYERLLRDFENERIHYKPIIHQKRFSYWLRMIMTCALGKKEPAIPQISPITTPLGATTIPNKKNKWRFIPHSNRVSQDKTDFSYLIRRRAQLELALENGASQLRRLHEQIILNRQALHPLLIEAAQTLAQAEADIQLMKK